jgi:hypothetical protein
VASFKDRPTLRKTLAAFIASAVALVGILVFGGDEEKDRSVVDELCRAGLERVAVVGGLDLCTHGPDPVRAFQVPEARLSSSSVNLYYPQSGLCPGDGVSGERVYLYVGSPSDRPAPTAAFIKRVKQTLGLAERQLRESHPTHTQKIQFHCATDSTPTLITRTFPAVGSDGAFTYYDAFDGIGGQSLGAGTHVAFVSGIGDVYPYCGEGSIREDTSAGQRHFSLIAPDCLAPNDTLLHELGHNMGAVSPAAPNDSGAWHCFDHWDVMCYDDGGPYFGSGGRMVNRCGPIAYNTPDGHLAHLPRFDCGHDDYWSPTSSLGWTDASTSPLLTKARRK